MSVFSARRRAQLKRLAGAGLLGSGGVAALVRAALADERRPLPSGIYSTQGRVQVNGQDAAEGMPVSAGDEVRTGTGAQAIYVVGQDAFLQREGSIVGFGLNAVQGFLRVTTGGLLSVFGRGDKTLLTPTAIIGIRGTGCYIEASPKLVYFCLCYGVADLVPLVDPAAAVRIETRHHDHPLLIHDDSGMPAMVDGTVVNHTDDELTMLEALVGRRPPFEAAGKSRY